MASEHDRSPSSNESTRRIHSRRCVWNSSTRFRRIPISKCSRSGRKTCCARRHAMMPTPGAGFARSIEPPATEDFKLADAQLVIARGYGFRAGPTCGADSLADEDAARTVPRRAALRWRVACASCWRRMPTCGRR